MTVRRRFVDHQGVVVTSNGSDAGNRMVDHYVTITLKQQRELNAWVDKLRAMGVKAAHPDDGWVDRERQTVRLQNAQFDDGLKRGELLALGSPDRYRVVLVVRFEKDKFQNDGVWLFVTEAVD